MALSLVATVPSFLGASTPPIAFNAVRTSSLVMKGTKISRKERKALSTEEMTGVVVPTVGVEESYDAGVLPEPPAPEPAATGSKLPPIAGSTKAIVEEIKTEAATRTQWNPEGLDISTVPGPIRSQFVPEYLKTSPAYLDGSMAGDFGFDPWGLVALANPTAKTDGFARTAAARDSKMRSMTADEQKQNLMWMRESELKHGRLAMLAAAGWPLSELSSTDFLKELGTNGRAPSLFNGHLLDFLPVLLVVFGPIAFLESQNKNVIEGDYGFDPLGLAGEQRPYGAFPFDAFLGSKTPIDGLPNLKDMEAMKLAEIKNGRLAMMAITGMAVQEFLWGSPVVAQTPFFFGR